MTATADQFSPLFRFADWPNAQVPLVAAGVYAIWRGPTERRELVYCGMSGREYERKVVQASRPPKRYGLVTRLHSHASGKLSGDQFCVYVANRIVIPTLTTADLPAFATGDATLDEKTRTYIRAELSYQFAVTAGGREAFALERACRAGEVFGRKPLLNPAL